MPLIFDEETKKNLQLQMLENGYRLIKKYGLKKTSVEEIARTSGIAKGTFYNFFKSKENFVYEIVLYKRNQARNDFQSLLNSSNKITRKNFKKYLETLLYGDYNLFAHLSEDDLAILKNRWPKEYFINAKNDESTSKWMLNHIDNISEDCNWKIFSNNMKALAIIQANKDTLYNEVYEQTIDMFINTLIDYLYKDS